MGRVFVVEFDDFDTKNFYLCKVCHTPLARNTDVIRFLKLDGIWVDKYVASSIMSRLSNVEISGAVDEVSTDHAYCCTRYINCIACNNQVGIRLDYRQNDIAFELNKLLSKKIMFRIAGLVYHPDMVRPEDFFDLPYPPSVVAPSNDDD